MNKNINNMMNDFFDFELSPSFSSLHFSNENESQLQSIVAINSTVLGPALGGCRFVQYNSTNDAVRDALNLARGMTYKAAFNKLPFGGGKAVILMPSNLQDRRVLMESYGDFIESLSGQFITAVDSGTNTADMDIVSQRTKHVVCTSKLLAGSGDPSPYTARGVLRGIQAAAKQVLGRNTLEDLHVIIQGVGHVGYHLAQFLSEQGVRLSVSDISREAIVQCQDEFSAAVIEPDSVYLTACDILSPCALGQVINPETIKQLNTKIIAGAANTQLSNEQLGEQLRQKEIMFIPDFVINSGGLLQIAYIENEKELSRNIENIYDSVQMIIDKSQKDDIASNVVAINMAETVLAEHQKENTLSIVNGL